MPKIRVEIEVPEGHYCLYINDRWCPHEKNGDCIIFGKKESTLKHPDCEAAEVETCQK